MGATTSVGNSASLAQPISSRTAYVNVCVPSAAAEALNNPDSTPVPAQTPLSGAAAGNSTVPSLAQTAHSDCTEISGSASTSHCNVANDSHPKESVTATIAATDPGTSNGPVLASQGESPSATAGPSHTKVYDAKSVAPSMATSPNAVSPAQTTTSFNAVSSGNAVTSTAVLSLTAQEAMPTA